MKFKICSTDEATFDDVIGMVPVVGVETRFAVCCDVWDELPEYVKEDITVLLDNV